MDDSYLESELKRRQAAVVHFSHHANMREGGVFPEDLQQAIANKDQWALSCCVVWPGHQMDLPGDIGIVFTPSVSSVLSVKDSDSGSMLAHDGTELSLGEQLTCASFEKTFCPTGAYNEWRVKGAAVSGIFIRDRWSSRAKTKQQVLGGPEPIETIATWPVSLEEVFSAFPSLPVYSHDSGLLVEISR